MLNDALGMAAFKEARHAGVTMCLHDDQVCLHLSRHLANSVEDRGVISHMTV